MEQASFWPQEYSNSVTGFTDLPRCRTVEIGEHKLSLPTRASLHHPIDRFSTGENPLPIGLVPNPIHNFPPILPTAMQGLHFGPSEHDAVSWRSSMHEDDRNSLSTDGSSSSGNANSTAWNQRGSISTLSDYQSPSLPGAFREEPPSPPDTTFQYRAAEVIDPSLTLNYQDPDIYNYKETPIKFEFPQCFLPFDEAEYEQDQYQTEQYQQHYENENLPNFNNNWARKAPVTRSQAQHEGRPQETSTRHSGNGSDKTPRSPKTLSPISNKKIFRRRSSSSEDESPTRNNARPKTYKRKIPFFSCNEEGCKDTRFRNRSELKKHIETQHTKPYICIFGFTKCNQRFGAANEWKRHIATQHLMLYKYVCDHPRCRDKPKAKILFNRGDLFMKHQERMHSPSDIEKRAPDDRELIEWKEEMKRTKARCEHLRSPPQKLTCGFCGDVFQKGDATWKEMMDHVKLHYQQSDDVVQNGWTDDLDLIAWMRENGLHSDKDTMDIDSETPDSRKSRKHSFASSSGCSSANARQIKLEQMDA